MAKGSKVSITFTRNYTVQPDGPSYAAGKTVSVSPASAQHFIDRGAAALATNTEATSEPDTVSDQDAHAPDG